jgi:hypothetical protein
MHLEIDAYRSYSRQGESTGVRASDAVTRELHPRLGYKKKASELVRHPNAAIFSHDN